jgi:hypothetical protein
LFLSSDTFSIKVSTLVFESIFGLKLLSFNGKGVSILIFDESTVLVNISGVPHTSFVSVFISPETILELDAVGVNEPSEVGGEPIEFQLSLACSFKFSKLGDENNFFISSFLDLLTNSIISLSGTSFGFTTPELFVGIMELLLLLNVGPSPPPGRLEKIQSINATPLFLISSK